MKIKIAGIVLLFSSLICAQEQTEQNQPEPLDPAYMGVQGMVVVSNGSTLYASYLTRPSKYQDVQLIYKLDAKYPPLTFLVRDADLVTIKSKPFNLQRLIRGEQVTTLVDVYMGYFDRGGVLTYQNVEVTLEEQLYMRKLDRAEKSSKRQIYDSVPVKNGARILVHQIQSAPSYDHLVLMYENIGCITEFDTRSAVPEQNEILQRLSFCGSMKPLYFDTQTFN